MGFGFSQSDSSQESASGVPLEFREDASRQGLDLLRQIQPLIDRFSQLTPDLGLNQFGLQAGTQRLFDESLNQALRSSTNRFSSNLATRGLNRPENIVSVIDQASRAAQREVLPTFAPLAAQNQLFQAQAPSNQLALTIQALQNLGSLFQGFTRGSEGKSAADAIGFDVSVSGSGGGGSSSTSQPSGAT